MTFQGGAFPATNTFRPARRIGWRAMWVIVLLLGLAMAGHDLYVTRWNGSLSIGGEALWGRDFVNVYTAGKLTLQHRLDLLYDVDAYRAYQNAAFHGGLKWHNYSYPPATLIYAWIFALVPYPVALFCWLAGTGAFFAWAARPYLREAGLPWWMALVAPASVVNLWAGHYGFLIGGLWLAAWHHLPRRPILSGTLIGLMVFKPHLAVLLPLVLLWRREWKALAAATATMTGLIALSVLLFGPQLWIVYLTKTAMVQAAMVEGVGTFYILMMPTVAPTLALIHFPAALGLAIQACVALAAIVILLRRLPADAHRAGLATATVTFLVLPYAFTYDMTVAGLAGLILFHRAGQEETMARYRVAAGLAALVPMTAPYFNYLGWPLTPVLVAFQAAALLGFASRWGGSRHSPAPAGAMARIG
jgi:alpha-1,2-mannosyltransferase